MQEKNGKPSVYTHIYWLIQDGKIEPNDIFTFFKFYWPEFIKIDEHIFLKEKFSEEEYNHLTEENENTEYWINLITIDNFFSELSDGEDRSMCLSKALIEIWGEKLKIDFPELNFTVKGIWSEEFGDCGLTFYQTNEVNNLQKAIIFNEIANPNIKENKIEQSSHGPRPGMPKIRKPRPDELPK